MVPALILSSILTKQDQYISISLRKYSTVVFVPTDLGIHLAADLLSKITEEVTLVGGAYAGGTTQVYRLDVKRDSNVLIPRLEFRNNPNSKLTDKVISGYDTYKFRDINGVLVLAPLLLNECGIVAELLKNYGGWE